MNIEGVEKKLREARFALDQMIEQDRMAASKEEQFDLYLSGLLAAGMSIRNAFHVEQDRKRNEAVKKWKSDWEARLSPKDAFGTSCARTVTMRSTETVQAVQ